MDGLRDSGDECGECYPPQDACDGAFLFTEFFEPVAFSKMQEYVITYQHCKYDANGNMNPNGCYTPAACCLKLDARNQHGNCDR